MLHRTYHDGVIKWEHFLRYWTFVRGIHRSPVNSPHKGQWRGALIFSLICVWIERWVNNHEAGDLERHRAHYDVIVMQINNPRDSQFVYQYQDLKTIAQGQAVFLCVERRFDTRNTWTWMCRKRPASVTSSGYVHIVVLFTGVYTSHVTIFTCNQ